MRAQGVPGIRYLDAMSRTAGEGTHNYVVWDDSLIDIMRKYANPETAAAPSLLLNSEDGQQNPLLANADPAYDANDILRYMRRPQEAAPWIEPQDVQRQMQTERPIWWDKPEPPEKERLLPRREKW